MFVGEISTKCEATHWDEQCVLWICGVMANTSVSNTEALGSTPCKSVYCPFAKW